MARCKRRDAFKTANSTLVRSVRPRLATADVCPGFLCNTSYSEAPSRLARWIARLVEFLENKLACSPLTLLSVRRLGETDRSLRVNLVLQLGGHDCGIRSVYGMLLSMWHRAVW
jgi:hypothetical protein